jgi:hypothetical protein
LKKESCEPLIPRVFVTQYPPITSNFTDISDHWLSTLSKLKFSDNKWAVSFGEIFFGEFEQGAKQT